MNSNYPALRERSRAWSRLARRACAAVSWAEQLFASVDRGLAEGRRPGRRGVVEAGAPTLRPRELPLHLPGGLQAE